METFRATFLHNIKCNYWGKTDDKKGISFLGVHEHAYSTIKAIKYQAYLLGIEYIWHFYEPYVEITWYGTQEQSDKLYSYIEEVLKVNGITDLKKEKGMGADWYCKNDREREFGGKRHALCSVYVDLIDEYKEDIEKGMGVEQQVIRTIHTLCNPLGLNYVAEARICFRRGLLCLLYKFLSYKWAVWVYKNILRQPY